MRLGAVRAGRDYRVEGHFAAPAEPGLNLERDVPFARSRSQHRQDVPERPVREILGAGNHLDLDRFLCATQLLDQVMGRDEARPLHLLLEQAELAERHVVLLDAEPANPFEVIRRQAGVEVAGEHTFAATLHLRLYLFFVPEVRVEPGSLAGDKHRPVGAGVAG